MKAIQEELSKTHIRYFILAMLFVVTTMNYVDRATLSMAAPAMRKDLGLDAVSMGYAFFCFWLVVYGAANSRRFGCWIAMVRAWFTV